MSSARRVAVVTGSNRGIGLAIVKGLCQKFNGIVYLTSRNEAKGNKAATDLKGLGFNPSYHQLDIHSDESVNKFKDYLKDKYTGIDLLVNNAGIGFHAPALEPVAVQAEIAVTTNYFGTLRVCNALFPLLKQDARVVHMSSSAGHLSRIPSPAIREKLVNSSLTISALSDLMNEYVREAKAGTNEQNGWGINSYVVSKVGITAMTRIQQREFNKESPNRNISVNAVHPGYVDTDMTKHEGPLTIDEGAKAPLFLSLESHGLKGEYVWNDCRVIDWLAPAAPTNPPSKT